MNIDFTVMTDEDIFEMQSLLNTEKRRRKDEPKLPVYLVSDTAFKSLDAALICLKNKADCAINFKKGGSTAYFKSYIDDEFKKDLLSLKVEFWNESEYKIRPDLTWYI